MQAEFVDKLLRAAGQGRIESVRDLIEKGVGVDSCNDIGYTAMMSAARSYRVEIVDFLLKHGASVNRQTSDGQTALHCAVGETPSLPEKQAECVRLLLRSGADPNAQDKSGITPVMNAAWFGCIHSIRAFVEKGANLSIVDNQGQTAKAIAEKRGHTEIAELLT